MILNEPDLSAAELISVKTPTLIMAGQFDIVHRIHTLKMARLIPGSEVCIVPGEGHTSYLTRSAEKCVKRVLPFIEKAREKLL